MEVIQMLLESNDENFKGPLDLTQKDEHDESPFEMAMRFDVQLIVDLIASKMTGLGTFVDQCMIR